MRLIYKYLHEDKSIGFDEFWQDKSGDFDKNDKVHVTYMIELVQKELNLDEYAIKRLESTIKSELPFFAKKRFIAKKWLLDNFNM